MAYGCSLTLIEMTETGEEKFPKFTKEVANLSASIFNSSLGVGYLIAPLYGSSLTQYYGFRLTMDITAGIDLTFAIAYLLCAGGISAFVETYYNLKKIEAAQEDKEDIPLRKEVYIFSD